MKYKIERIKQEGTFKPFSVTLTFETKEEYVNFHNKVMRKITGCVVHGFHGDIYKAGVGEQDSAEGRI